MKLPMVTSLLILGLGLLPALLSIWGAKRGQRLAQARLQAAARANRYRSLATRQPEQFYLRGIGEMIGDLSCRHNARSPHLRCAVNPSGPCRNCHDYASLEGLEK